MYKRSFATLFSILVLLALFIKYIFTLFTIINYSSSNDIASSLIVNTALLCFILLINTIIAIIALKNRSVQYLYFELVLSLILTVFIYFIDTPSLVMLIVLDVMVFHSIKVQSEYNKNE